MLNISIGTNHIVECLSTKPAVILIRDGDEVSF